MDKYNYTIIESWWRHLGTFDRQIVSGILTSTMHLWTAEDTQEYLQVTDDWWDDLSDWERLEVYNEFFDES